MMTWITDEMSKSQRRVEMREIASVVKNYRRTAHDGFFYAAQARLAQINIRFYNRFTAMRYRMPPLPPVPPLDEGWV